ncbi:peptidase S14 [Tsuneonella sp. SYSU-LHT278]|uniref:peptidase S14 n=1 Tax=Tsuneonella sediminis TaxID=3416089 RepID=UPI003F793B47
MARSDPAVEALCSATVADISLIGTVDEAMVRLLRDKLGALPADGAPVLLDMTTLGGDPEMARRMIADLDSARSRCPGRRFRFLGRSVVYSAGATFMAGFRRDERYLARDAMLLLHCRQIKKTLEMDGPVRAMVPRMEALLHEFRTGIDLEVENFKRLIEGSDVTLDELLEKALYNWYLSAEEAAARGLIAGIVNP